MLYFIRQTMAISQNRAGHRPRPLLLGLIIGLTSVTGPALHAQQLSLDARKPEIRALIDIYHLDSSGNETPHSLDSIDWTPAQDSMLLSGRSSGVGDWFPLLPLSEDGELTATDSSIALGTETSKGVRRAALGANLIHDLVQPHLSGGTADARSEAWLEHLVAWLVKRDMPFAAVGARELNIVLAHVAAPAGDNEDAVTRNWFELKGDHITVSEAWSCDGALLLACLDEADLVVLGPGLNQSLSIGTSQESTQAEADAITAALTQMDSLGIPTLYVHDGAVNSTLATSALNALALNAQENVKGLNVIMASAAELYSQEPAIAAAKP